MQTQMRESGCTQVGVTRAGCVQVGVTAVAAFFKVANVSRHLFFGCVQVRVTACRFETLSVYPRPQLESCCGT
jgi:hypothetical protein